MTAEELIEEQTKLPTSSSDVVEDPKEALLKDQHAKKQVLIETITSLCDSNSDFEDVRKVADALKAGGQLQCKIISGGATNFSYKVYVKDDPDGVALFAKVCFQNALWNPDKSVHYDLARVENEFLMMKRFAQIMGGYQQAPVAIPYFCVDVAGETEDEKMKVLICEWSLADEQWCNQFIDGHVDMRIIPTVAHAIATLNCCETTNDDGTFDPMFNDNVRPCMLSMFPLFKDMLTQLACSSDDDDEGKHEDTPKDKFVAYCRELGGERLAQLVDGLEADYMKRDMLSHSDTHVFNILCEKKPNIETLESFGVNGSFVICDWEMAFVGPIGRDTGFFLGWPLACAFCHAVQGHEKEAHHLLETTIQFWTAYAETMKVKGNKDEVFLRDQFRDTLGWTSFFVILAYYLFHINCQHLPLEGVTEEGKTNAMGSLAYTGLRFMEYGIGNEEPDLTLEQLRAKYKEIILHDITELLQYAAQQRQRMRPRRASMLRASGRRISDAGAMEAAAAAELVRRASHSSVDAGGGGGGQRLSICQRLSPDEIAEALASVEE